METFGITSKTYVNRVLWLGLCALMLVLLWFMVNASLSCVNSDGCLKSWCEREWFSSELKALLAKDGCV